MFKDQPVTFSNFNVRTELNGEERKPAADINCSAQLPNTILNAFAPGMLGLLYERPQNPDLAEQAVQMLPRRCACRCWARR